MHYSDTIFILSSASDNPRFCTHWAQKRLLDIRICQRWCWLCLLTKSKELLQPWDLAHVWKRKYCCIWCQNHPNDPRNCELRRMQVGNIILVPMLIFIICISYNMNVYFYTCKRTPLNGTRDTGQQWTNVRTQLE